MTTTVAPEQDVAALAAVVEHPSLADEFETWQGRVRDAWEDPFHPRELTWIARDGGTPVGFALAYVLPSTPAPFGMVRLGVLDAYRRQGIGTRLLRAAQHALDTRTGIHEWSLNAWVPNAAAQGLAERNGFRRARTFWLMERPRGAGSPAGARLPDGIELRVFDGGDAGLRDFTGAYNDAFAQHYHFVRTGVDDARAIAGRAGFPADGLALAYRDGACVGFCRNELMSGRGEIAVLGTVPAARGLGLGRALLRWGVAWLQSQDSPRITLLVDGENESALELYRSEGFEVARTRQVWSMPAPDRGAEPSS